MGRCCTYYPIANSTVAVPEANNNNLTAHPIWSLTSPSAYGPLAGMDTSYDLQFRGWRTSPVGGPGFVGSAWHHRPGTAISVAWNARECGWEAAGGGAWIGRPCIRTMDRKWLGEASRWDSVTPPANVGYAGIPPFRPARQLTGYIATGVGDDKLRLYELKLPTGSGWGDVGTVGVDLEPFVQGSHVGTSPPNFPASWSNGQLASSLSTGYLNGDDYYISGPSRQSRVYAGNADPFGAAHSWVLSSAPMTLRRISTAAFVGYTPATWFDDMVAYSEWGDAVIDDFIGEVFSYPGSLGISAGKVTLQMTGSQYVEFDHPAINLPHVDQLTPYRIGYRYMVQETDVGTVIDPWTSQTCTVYALGQFRHDMLTNFSFPGNWLLGSIQFQARDPSNSLVGSGDIAILAPATRATATLTYSAPVGMDAYDQYGNLGAGLMRGVTVG